MREKTDSKKTTKKKEEMKSEVIVQHMGNDISVEKTVDKIIEMYVAEGHYRISIKSLQVYIKPEENAAYYVINHKQNGKIDLT